MNMDWYGLGGLFWMTGMGGRVEVVRIRIYRIGTMMVRRYVDTGSSVE